MTFNWGDLPEGWSAIPLDQLRWYNDKVAWLQALEAAGLEDNSELIEEAHSILAQWRKEELEEADRIVETWEKDQK